MAVRCPSCGRENASDAGFCAECGSVLNPDVSAPPAASAAELSEGERKTVTVMFADIEGSMSLTEGLDPEHARAMLDPVMALMAEAVNRYDGYVAQALGDGIFAIFGAPQAHEDHPVRAIHAALSMQQEMRRYSAQRQQSGNPPMHIRVGINTGEVVMRSFRANQEHSEYTPVGHASSLAARLQAIAGRDGIVVSDRTRGLAEGYFHFRQLAPQQIKGVRGMVVAHEVLGESASRTRLEVAEHRGLARFVGRAEEISRLDKAFADVRNGHGQVIAAVGDPGVGKSRLFHEFKTKSGGYRVLQASGLAHNERWAYLPISDLLRTFFEIAGADDASTRREKIRAAVASVEFGPADITPYLLSLLGASEAENPLSQMDPQVRRQRTHEAITQLFIRASEHEPIVLIIEDLHWLDAASVEMINLLVDSLADSRILLLLNYRPEFSHKWTDKPYYQEFRLEPLEQSSADQLLDALLGGGPDLGEIKRLIIERSHRNPLFIEEIVRTLFENGTLQRTGQVTLTRPLESIDIPVTVQGIIAGRIDRLQEDQKHLLQMLAVVGEEWPLAIAARVVERPEADLARAIAHLQERQFILRNPDQAAYRFRHALTHDVAYSSVLLDRRQAIHSKTAAAMETIYSDRIDDHLAELVHHYGRSGDTRKTIQYLTLAGQHAFDHSAIRDAELYFGRGLSLVRQLPDGLETTQAELNLQLGLGNALMYVKGFSAPEVETAFGQARRLCDRVPETAALIPALFGLWVFNFFSGALSQARELGHQLVALGERTNDSGALVIGHQALGHTFLNFGDFDLALSHSRKGAELFALEQPLPTFLDQNRIACYGYIGIALAFLGYCDQARAVCHEQIDAVLDTLQIPSKVGAVTCEGFVELLLRDGVAAQRRAETLMALSEGALPMQFIWARLHLGYALALQGRFDEGIARLREALESSVRVGLRTHLTDIHTWMADAYLGAGRAEAAKQSIEAGFAASAETGELWFIAELHRLKGEVILTLHPAATHEAEASFREAVEIAHRQGARLLEMRSLVSLTRLMARQGRPDEPASRLERLHASFRYESEPEDLRAARQLLEDLGTGRTSRAS